MSQRMEALARANHIRLAQAALRRHLQALPLDDAWNLTAHMIRNPNETVSGMRVRHLIVAVPGIGASKAERLFHRAGISNTDRRVSELTDRQRDTLADLLENAPDGFRRISSGPRRDAA